MTNENESFIREVNEELRSDQMKAIWKKFGLVIIVLAVAIVFGTAGWRGYQYWSGKQASVSGDAFLSAMKLASENKPAEALAAYEKLEKDGYGAYPDLARMRAATLTAAKDPKAAAEQFASIGKDTSIAEPLRDAAKLRAAWLMVETEPYAAVSAQVEDFTTGQNPMRHSAREVLGLSAYKNGDFKRAKEWYQAITNDQLTPANIGHRAQIMLDVMAADGKA